MINDLTKQQIADISLSIPDQELAKQAHGMNFLR